MSHAFEVIFFGIAFLAGLTVIVGMIVTNLGEVKRALGIAPKLSNPYALPPRKRRVAKEYTFKNKKAG